MHLAQARNRVGPRLKYECPTHSDGFIGVLFLTASDLALTSGTSLSYVSWHSRVLRLQRLWLASRAETRTVRGYLTLPSTPTDGFKSDQFGWRGF